MAQCFRRVKEDVQPIENALAKVNALTGVTFERTDVEGDQRFMGFVAQDVEPHVPEVVHTDDSEAGLKAVSYANMVALLTEAVKEQGKQIKELQQEIKDLKVNK